MPQTDRDLARLAARVGRQLLHSQRGVAMAPSALTRRGERLAVAVTGIAGPGGAVPGKPVGTVWLGWAERHGRAIRVAVPLQHFRGARGGVRRTTVRGE